MTAAAAPRTIDEIPAEVLPLKRPYRPHGELLKAWFCRANECLVAGPAGTGKSRLLLELLHYRAEKYKGSRQLILRKTRASLTQSALVTFEEKVVPVGHPILGRVTREHRQSYRYPNGSEIVVGGLDNPTRVMSTEYETIYVQEAIELLEDEWEKLTTRLRSGVMPFHQLLADTNPDVGTHWLKQRASRGQTLMIESRHEDNPSVTPEYLATLDQLTGVRKQRLRYGLWVSAEGMVYEDWDPAIHRIDRFEVPKEWPRIWGVDFGFTNPFCFQAWARDDDGRLYRFAEIYRTGRLVEDHARDILAWQQQQQEPWPIALVCDTDAEDRATLERHIGMTTEAAYKAVSPGIQNVAARLRVAGDGKPRLFFLRDAVLYRDPVLDERKKPTCTEEEVEGYVWSLTANRRKGEEPVKENDHGCDCARYVCAFADGLTDEEDKSYLAYAASTGGPSGWFKR